MQTSIPKQCRTTRSHRKQWLADVARLLLIVFGGMLLVPLLPASTLEAGLAICCKRSGKHLCFAPLSSRLTVSRLDGNGLSEKCPYKIRHSLPGRVTTLGLAAASTPALTLENFSDQVRILQRFSACSQQANLKRGPPLGSVNLFA
jgi:hypothetical protein